MYFQRPCLATAFALVLGSHKRSTAGGSPSYAVGHRNAAFPFRVSFPNVELRLPFCHTAIVAERLFTMKVRLWPLDIFTAPRAGLSESAGTSRKGLAMTGSRATGTRAIDLSAPSRTEGITTLETLTRTGDAIPPGGQIAGCRAILAFVAGACIEYETGTAAQTSACPAVGTALWTS